MALQTDLMGLGEPSRLAEKLGYNPLAVTAAGTSAGAATAINTKMATITAASSQTGVILPNVPGDVWFLACTSSTSAVVYPASGATITGASSQTLAQNKNMIVWQVSSTVYFHVILA
jgi:hypothetical protein